MWAQERGHDFCLSLSNSQTMTMCLSSCLCPFVCLHPSVYLSPMFVRLPASRLSTNIHAQQSDLQAKRTGRQIGRQARAEWGGVRKVGMQAGRWVDRLQRICWQHRGTAGIAVGQGLCLCLVLPPYLCCFVPVFMSAGTLKAPRPHVLCSLVGFNLGSVGSGAAGTVPGLSARAIQ